MSKKYFITGTDTDAGKTLCTAGLLSLAKSQGQSTIGLKPIASGCEHTEEGLRNSDALALMEQSTLKLAYEQINPISFEPAIAPHIAALQEKKSLSAERIVGLLRGTLMTKRVDFTCIEGAGGWRVPLNPREYLSAVPKEMNLPVILVVGMKLGCINHAMLTVEAIQRDGLTVAGWIANQVEPDMPVYKENLLTLQTLIHAPMLGEVPYLQHATAEAAAEFLSLPE